MILYSAPDIDADLYCYETSLSFGENFCKDILEKILVDSNFLPLRSTYLDPNKNIDKIFEQLNFSEQKSFMRRMSQCRKVYEDRVPAEFLQYGLPPELEDTFKKILPSWITAEVSNIAIQISKGGDYMAPHEDPKRKSALFILLQGSEETHWYRSTGKFDVFDFFNIPDLDKIETVVTAKLEPFKWTVFNHKEYHSVDNFSKEHARISMQVEFNNLSAEELVKIVKQHESTQNA